MPKPCTTVVLDAGGRYGLHPTWKPFKGELNYFLFELDGQEARRLAEKYRDRADEIIVVNKALSDRDEDITVSYFRNRAMTSTVTRNPISALFQTERLSEVDITGTEVISATSIDKFCQQNRLAADFLKLDTEGTEYKILEGAKLQLQDNLWGVRSEVAFDYIFEGMPLFGEINQLMLDNDFFLLNIDYTGQGDYQNDFVKVDGRYGILTSSDAVWLKRIPYLFDKVRGVSTTIEEQVLKYAAFCFNNNAPDVATKVLLEGVQAHSLDYNTLRGTRLFSFVNIATQKLFYSLKWQPGQTLVSHQETYQRMFGLPMKTVNEFMESLELNPD